MAIEKLGTLLSFPANADLSAAQYKVVCLGSDGTVDLPKTAITAKPLGILQNAPKAGEEAVVALLGCGGVSKAWANDALARGAVVGLEWVNDGDSGKVKAVAATQYPVGIVVYPSDAEDDLCSVLLTPVTVVAA